MPRTLPMLRSVTRCAVPSRHDADKAMNTIVLDDQVVHIPAWVTDLAAFRRWVRSDEFPEKQRICYLKGEVWVDMSREQFYSHNQVKGEFTIVVGGLVRAKRSGRYIPDGMLLTNPAADLICVPDGSFASNASLRTGRVRLLEGVHEGFLEIEGTPDMVLEIVSASSVVKDTVTLRDLYWQAGMPEYWLVDVRGDRLEFNILRHTPPGYVANRKVGGWIKSAVFGKSFRLTRGLDALGNPEYTLQVR
jgi:Uma2 family endonuclease